jgi:hypothetical protein
MTSSIEYRRAKEGKATTTRINDGRTVQTISITVPCTTFLDCSMSITGLLNHCKVRKSTTKTKKKIKVMKNIKS